MKIIIAKRAVKVVLAAALVLFSSGTLGGQSSTVNKPSAGNQTGDEATILKDFTARIQGYVKLHKKVESKIPGLKSTDLPELIVAHQQVLARKIREARPNADAGDIFTMPIADVFRRMVREAHADSPAGKSGVPLGRTEPATPVTLRINGSYPSTVPYTAVSPALLAKFPKLPDEVAYRVAQRDLVLIDVKANLVVDIARDLLPPITLETVDKPCNDAMHCR